MVIKDSGKEERTVLLDERLLISPSIAINVIQSGNMIFSEHDYFKELSEKEKDEYEKNRNIYKERFALPE